MLVDTGAMQSREDPSCTPNAVAALVATNRRLIRSYSTKTLKISILGFTYDWPFIIGNVKVPLLGADSRAQHGLLVDVGCKCLLDMGTCCSQPLTAGLGVPTIYSIAPHIALLQEFPNVFKRELSQVARTMAKYGFYHHVTTKGPPTHTKFCRLPPKQLQDVKGRLGQ
ncbi:uncharacterized protein LOC135211325 [Macrobrachium nipponense]|uniref:uncharacterized protein LOC135211325 n=1 Tax=Macrobrachium nipponense TaxID=159736 RepID=UPI0030C7E217